jgi:hypothetical protein
MKWFCLVCFVAGVIVVIFFIGVIAYVIVTHRVSPRNFRFMILCVIFLLYATREMFKGYRQRA